MQWNYLSNFKWLENKLLFPEIISPMKYGKFIIFTRNFTTEIMKALTI